MASILIKNGTIVDGTGAPPRRGDLALSGEKITQITETISSRADTVIDAKDRVVSPGFIDILNHADAYLTLLKNPSSESLVAQGITTAVVGNCGASLAPLTHGRFVAAMQKWAEVRDVNVDWERFGEFLDVVGRLRPALNIASLVGHGMLRRVVLGDEIREPSGTELEAMRALLQGALQDGAFGLSFAPQYVHAREASTHEIDALAELVRERNGYLAAHLRDESDEIEDSLYEALAIAERTKVSLQLSHLKPYGAKADRSFPDLLARIDEAAAKGINVHFDVFPWQVSFIVSYLLLPVWAQEGGVQVMRKRLRDTPTAKKIFTEMKAARIAWEHYRIAETKYLSENIGKTVAEAAARERIAPEEFFIRSFIRHEGRVLLLRDTKDRSALRKALAHPRSFIASAGGGYRTDVENASRLVHPRSFGAMPKFLSKFVLAEKLMTLEEGIAKITSRPAQKLGLSDRGVLEAGKTADIVVFDPAKLFNRSTFENPYQYPDGIDWVFVNGVAVVNPDGITGERSGKTLKKQ